MPVGTPTNGREAVPGLATPDPRQASRGRWNALPPDVMRQVGSRIRAFAVAIAVLWAIVLGLHVAAPLLGHHHDSTMAWPMPGNAISAAGLAVSLVLFLLARRLGDRGSTLVNLGLTCQIVNAALVAVLVNWHPAIDANRISWLCWIILVQPALVPAPPAKTLAVSLLIATMDPFALWLAQLRGIPLSADPFILTWYLLPNYLSVGMAVLSSTVISGLGRRVHQARELGSYQLGELLGRGGMGEVYLAHHRMLARPAAIKLIRPEALAGGDAAMSRTAIGRFHREAQAVALLRSPHTVSLYDFGVTEDGTFYYAMELLDGFNLETLVRRFGPVPPERAIALLRHVCRSLGEAHARGLVHRDVKPSNIFACRLGLNVDVGKVLDFGLVKVGRRDTTETASLATQADVSTGTPAFMAPEQALGEAVDDRTDLYGVGCVAYWLLTGRLVFQAETPIQTMLLHVQAKPVPPSQWSEIPIPPELESIVLQCLAKSPSDRPRDAMTLACALESVPLRERWTRARAERWWDEHSPVEAPKTDLRPPTPAGTLHCVK